MGSLFDRYAMSGFLLLLLQIAPAGSTLEPLEIDRVPMHLAVAHLGSGEALSLLAVDGREVEVLFSEPEKTLSLPGLSTLWTTADLDEDGKDEFLVLVDGDSLYRLILHDGELTFSDPIASGLGAVTPVGCHPSNFIQDLDGKSPLELVLPFGNRVRILQGVDGVQGPLLSGAARLSLEVGSGRKGMLDRVGRTFSIPRLETRDISGDGVPDLLLDDMSTVRQFVAGPEGFPPEPTTVLNLEDFRADLEGFEFDPSNITRLVKYLVLDEWRDLNEDGKIDLVVLSNGRVKVFHGGAEGIDLTVPKQLVKVRGNVFFAETACIDEDSHPDLVLVRIEDLGLVRLAFSLVTSWSLDFEFLVFRGTAGGTFEKRVFREKVVTVKGDRLLGVIAEKKEEVSEKRKSIVRMCDLDGDGRSTDVVLLEASGRLRSWRGIADNPNVVDSLAENFLKETLAEEKNLAFDISMLGEWVLGRTSALLSLTSNKLPDSDRVLPGGWSAPHALTARDFDGDGVDELLALRLKDAEGESKLQGFRVIFD